MDLEVLCTLSWAIWGARNKLVYKGENRAPSTILDDAGLYLGAFHLCDMVERRQTPCPHRTLVRLSKPVDGLKLNVDAACRPGMEVDGVGACIRDSEGAMVACLAKKIVGRFSPHLAECIALRKGLEFAASRGLQVAFMESDAANVVSAVNERRTLGDDGVVIEDIVRLLSSVSGGICKHIPRSGNMVSHQLAFYGSSALVEFSGIDKSPLFLSEFVLADLAR
ncbi:hypothetical protein TIFTF001_037504 [Ficus carica]|uniref:RNase H type-1 domain-containing protein n=1 Tax=Ficus carica TaxID=3494 RepID=A0AA88E9U6_FICCA|nr:hypothetical protein TIFTF001_037484 [Ficus carica]GMN68431.1 hypothetical protein TIFTF001_037492 [Ficus carica]GMN68440.1 hypothetical protein TIFTF001_037496 [Ficus carica]GMN68443.1 hypothetical protein TIFTF001_037504 [Ficus carica]